jgi:hypothetical protein
MRSRQATRVSRSTELGVCWGHASQRSVGEALVIGDERLATSCEARRQHHSALASMRYRETIANDRQSDVELSDDIGRAEKGLEVASQRAFACEDRTTMFKSAVQTKQSC